MGGIFFAFLGFAIVAASALRWYQLIQGVAVPRDRTPYMVAFGVGAALGLVALGLGTGWLAGIPALLAVVGGGGFLALCAMSTQASREPAVAVGDAMIPFTALDPDGKPFELASLSGKPYLLKFFRGHW